MGKCNQGKGRGDSTEKRERAGEMQTGRGEGERRCNLVERGGGRGEVRHYTSQEMQRGNKQQGHAGKAGAKNFK